MLKPEGYTYQDDIEFLFNAKLKKYPVPAVISALDEADGRPVWVLTFPHAEGAKGLVPQEETGLPDAGLMEKFVGQKINVIIKGIDRETGLVAASRQEAVEKAEENLNLERGQKISAVVRAVLPKTEGKSARVVVDIGGGVLVEIPRKKAIIYRSLPLAVQFPVGKTVPVKITSLEPLKAVILIVDPWEKADFKRGQLLACSVVTAKDGIVFLEPDLAAGLIGIASMPLRGAITRGDRVSCVVTAFDRVGRKLHLRIRSRLV